MHPYRISTLTFAITMVVFFLLVAGLIWHLGDRMPAPHISPSAAFNEKALWLRHAFAQGRDADILIAGSSMAMDNINGAELAKISGTEAIINTGSWSLTIPQAFESVRILTQRLHPKLVILAVHYGDFETPELTTLDWSQFQKCAFGSNLVPLYLESLDAYAFRRAYYFRQADVARTRQIFETLYFDNYGGIPLSPDHFIYNAENWIGLKDPRLKNMNWDPEAFAAVRDMGAYLHERHCSLLVVACPMRPPLEEKYAEKFNAELWSKIPALLGANGQFVHAPGAEFDDTHFVDGIHLNALGGTKLVDRIAPHVRELLKTP